MLGPRAGVFTDENIPDEADDEDLRNDPVSKMDMTVSTFYLVFFFACMCIAAYSFIMLYGSCQTPLTLTIDF